jgi:hypothetical protein
MLWNMPMASACAGCTRMMTASSQPSSVRDRLKRDHLAGGVLALLVQAVFLWVFTTARHAERAGGRETILFLHPLPPPAPSMIDARGARRTRSPVTAPSAVPLSPLPQLSSPSPSDLQAFGRALFGCAPEHYAQLPPEERQHCPKPGEGLALNPPLALPGEERSHVKNNARWANALAHEQSQLLLPGGFLFPLAALGAILDGSITERSSAFRDPEKWPVYSSGPKPPNADERNQEARRNDPSQPDRQAPGRH